MQVLSFSAVSDWKTCRQKYYYRQVEKLRRRQVGLALKRGGVIHSLLEAHLRGEDWVQVLNLFRDEYALLMEEERELYGDLPEDCERIMRGYLRRYQDEPLETLAVELSFGMDGQDPIEVLPGVAVRGRIDWIAQDHRGVWVVEHKTAKVIPSEGFRLFDLQTALYTRVAEVMGYKPVGIAFDYLRTVAPTIPSINKDGSLSRRKINTDVETLMRVLNENGLPHSDYQEEIERARQTESQYYCRKYLPKPTKLVDTLLEELRIVALEIERLQHYPYRNLSRNCEHFCEYYPLCTTEVMGLDSDFVRETEYIRKEDVNVRSEEEVED